MFFTIGGIVLISLLLIQQLSLYLKCQVHAVLSTVQRIGFCIGMLVICLIVYFFANTVWHYIFAIIGMVTIVVMIFKSGIGASGIVIENRGKEYYSWNEIEQVNILDEEKGIIEIHTMKPKEVFVQHYNVEDIKKVKAILQTCFE